MSISSIIDIQLVIVSAPTTNEWNYGRHLGLEEWARRNKRPYIDFNVQNEKVKINWTRDTRDGGDHLNDYGAEKVTSYIGKYIKDNY